MRRKLPRTLQQLRVKALQRLALLVQLRCAPSSHPTKRATLRPRLRRARLAAPARVESAAAGERRGPRSQAAMSSAERRQRAALRTRRIAATSPAPTMGLSLAA